MGGCRSREQEEEEDPSHQVPCEFEDFQRLSYGYYLRGEGEGQGEGVETQAQEVEKFYYQDNNSSTFDQQSQELGYAESPCDNSLDEYSDWDIIEVDSYLHTIPEEEDFTESDTTDAPLVPLHRKDQKAQFSYPERRRQMFSSTQSDTTMTEEQDNDCVESRDRLSSSYSIDSFMSDSSAVSNNTFAPELYNEAKPTRIQIYLKYNQRSWLLTVGVKQAECSLTSVDRRRRIFWQVHMTLFPYKRHRHKTSYKSSLTPIFNQSFDIEEIATHALTQMSVRYRMYGRIGLTGRKKLAGEVEVELGCLIEQQDYIVKEWRSLKKRLASTPYKDS